MCQQFLKLNPLALIPILVDGDFVLAKSLAIIMYLDDKYPQYPLLPHDVPKKALNFQVAHIVLQNNIIEKKVGPHEKLPWAQSVIRKGFTALEKLLKDHAGRYATGDEIFLCKITWRILIGVAVENVIRQPIPEVSNCYSCLVNNAGIGLGDKYPIGSKVQAVWSEDRSASIFAAASLGMNKGMNTDTIVKAKSFFDGDEDQHKKDVFEKNLKALQKIF
ncbi:glutathione S-transferase 1-like [Arachis stenosperma]|uniref:glutathione S-transferase 1-like n=1 Tax=Arachis stenosperma TaxID=217475 RepID=UPI0025ACFC49|nr:glutathione S-transferase 1-like [Arachis stenosperma]